MLSVAKNGQWILLGGLSGVLPLLGVFVMNGQKAGFMAAACQTCIPLQDGISVLVGMNFAVELIKINVLCDAV